MRDRKRLQFWTIRNGSFTTGKMGQRTVLTAAARVTSIGQFTGFTTHYSNPTVRADFFDLGTGDLREANARLPAAGTYKTWRKLDPPDWTFMHLAQV